MRSAVLVLLLAASAGLAAAEKMGIWSPLYYKLVPNDKASGYYDEYQKFIDSVTADTCLSRSFQGAILTGPTSGPPLKKSEKPGPGMDARADQYQSRFDYLIKAGEWQPFGYIYTKYGDRPLDAVLADVDRWCDEVDGFRGSIRGVFVDSVARTFPPCDAKAKTCLGDYYQKVIDAIRTKCNSPTRGTPMIMLNPGTQFTECQFLKDNNIGFVNGFEATFKTYQDVSAKGQLNCPCKDTKLADGSFVRCVASVHTVPEGITEDEAVAAMQDFAKNGFSAIFLTENKMPKQYETVPAMWPTLAAAACKVDAYEPKAAHRRLLAH